MADRRIEYMPLDAIARAHRNPKRHATYAIAASVDRFGLAEVPCLDERTGRLVAGHGRLDDLTARHAAGQPAPDGVTTDDTGTWLVPVIRGWASRDDDHAAAYLLASNRTSELGGWDTGELDALLADIARTDLDLAEAAGWEIADLESLLEQAIPAVDEVEAAAYRPPPPIVHETVPATAAAYAETPEQEAAREQRIATYQPRVTEGTAEMILVYSLDDRAEVQRLIGAAREVLGSDLKAAEVVQRALRTLVAVLDDRDRAEPVRMARFARAAGWTGGE